MTASTDEAAFAAENVFGKGEPNTAYAQYFTGDSFLNNLVTNYRYFYSFQSPQKDFKKTLNIFL